MPSMAKANTDMIMVIKRELSSGLSRYVVAKETKIMFSTVTVIHLFTPLCYVKLHV